MQLYELPTHKSTLQRLSAAQFHQLSDEELLTTLLSALESSKAKRVVKKLLAKKTLLELLQMSVPRLLEFKGLTLSQAHTLRATYLISQLCATRELTPITSPKMIVGMLGYMVDFPQEHLVALYLNARYQVIKQKELSIGVINSTQVDAREAFVPALQCCAVGVVFAHNHPSEDPKPSQADEIVTKQLVAAGELLGITVLDHLVIAKRGWTSMREKGIL